MVRQILQQVAVHDARRIAAGPRAMRRAQAMQPVGLLGPHQRLQPGAVGCIGDVDRMQVEPEPPHHARMRRGSGVAGSADRKHRCVGRSAAAGGARHSRSHSDQAAGTDPPRRPLRSTPAAAAGAPAAAAAWRSGRAHWSACGAPASSRAPPRACVAQQGAKRRPVARRATDVAQRGEQQVGLAPVLRQRGEKSSANGSTATPSANAS